MTSKSYTSTLINTLETIAIITLVLFTFTTAQAGNCDYCETPAGGETIFCESFENYYEDYLTPQSYDWYRWSHQSDDALVTDYRSYHGHQALKVKRDGHYNPDVLLKLDNRYHGKYRLSWKMYVPNHKKAYYSIQHAEHPGNEAYEVFFEEDGRGRMQFGGNHHTQASFYYPHDRWFSVTQLIDLNNNKVELWVNGKFVKSWRFSYGEYEINQLGALNFYAKEHNKFYVDKICFTKLDVYAVYCTLDYFPVCVNDREFANECVASTWGYTDEEWRNCYENNHCENAIVCDNFENYNIYDGIAEQSYNWRKWNHDSRDGDVTDDKYSDGHTSLRIKDTGSHDKMDVVLDLGNQQYGNYKLSWKMFVEHGKRGYFNIQKDQYNLTSGGAFEMVFNENGMGTVKVWGQGEGTFYYPREQWMNIELYFDTDHNEVRFYLNGEWLFYWSMSNYCQIGAANFYAIHNAYFYMDEVCFQEIYEMPAFRDEHVNERSAKHELTAKIDMSKEKMTSLEVAENATSTTTTITEKMTVFPNPSQGISTVTMALEQAENIQIAIFNETGKLVKQMDLGQKDMINETIDITDQANGMYMVRVIGETVQQTQQIVKIQ